MTARDQQRDAAIVQFTLELVQRFDRIGVGLRHCLGVQHEPLHVFRLVHDLAGAAAKRVGIEEPDRRFEQPDDDARHRLRIGIQMQLAQHRFPRQPAQQRIARVARHVHGVQQRRAHRHGHTLQHAEPHHAHRGQDPERQFDP
ncbi:hypothetical protein G6F35_013873 [Rhizopus arrhizus]|nr:hypothetical protein G6F35_013873 [Rhizopus arrhizus]